MRKLLFLIFSAGAIYWFYTRYYSNPAYWGTLECPTTIAWREVDVSQGGFHSVSAIDGGRWRTEMEGRDGKTLFCVYDGQRYGSGPLGPRGPLPPEMARGLDPTAPVRKIFGDLPHLQYKGIEILDGHSCRHWHVPPSRPFPRVR